MVDLNTAILIVGLGVNLLVTAVVGTWKLSRVEIALRDAISSSEKEVDGRVEKQTRDFGETAASLRQGLQILDSTISHRIHEMEVFNRDTFMRRESFMAVRNEIVVDLKTLGEKIEARLERMEEKIDSKT